MRVAIVIGLGLAACGPRAVMRGEGTSVRVMEMGGAEEQRVEMVVSGRELVAEVMVPVNGVVISRLPAPHRMSAVAFTPASPEVARQLVGRREPREAGVFARDVAAAFTGVAVPEIGGTEALVAWAEQRGAYQAMKAGLVAGDVVVFDRVNIVAVVLGTDERGVSDVVYVARGVVRRGYVDAQRPKIARDRDGRVVNSYLRHDATQPPVGTRFLAGELASGRVRFR